MCTLYSISGCSDGAGGGWGCVSRKMGAGWEEEDENEEDEDDEEEEEDNRKAKTNSGRMFERVDQWHN